jgi:hypothetical protein
MNHDLASSRAHFAFGYRWGVWIKDGAVLLVYGDLYAIVPQEM